MDVLGLKVVDPGLSCFLGATATKFGSRSCLFSWRLS